MEGELMPYQNAIANAAVDFEKVDLAFDQEKVFAIQHLTKDKTGFALSVANKNPMSVRMAMSNLAATGLTLNPAYSYAALVPRDNAIVLDIMYRGLLKIATDTGAIAWGRADVVYKTDRFVYHGPAHSPVHEAYPFGDRGEVVGAYCVAKTTAGDILCDVMTLAELEKVRASSDLWRKKQSGPWRDWFEEMCKKSVIKRARKTWPMSSKVDRLLDAIELANASEGGYTFDALPVETVSAEQAATLRDLIDAIGSEHGAAFLDLFGVESIDAIPAARYNEAVATLKRKGAQ